MKTISKRSEMFSTKGFVQLAGSFVIIACIAIACSEQSGIYVKIGRTADSIELRGDGTVFVREKDKGFEGKMRTWGDSLELAVNVMGITVFRKGRFTSDTLFVEEEGTYVRLRQ